MKESIWGTRLKVKQTITGQKRIVSKDSWEEFGSLQEFGLLCACGRPELLGMSIGRVYFI
jgi:hypothetical protein